MPRIAADLAGRTIHAQLPDRGLMVAHHATSGKWAIERPDGSDRRYLSLDQAVAVARVLVDRGGYMIPDVPGGRRFDYLWYHSAPNQARHAGIPDLVDA